ncbi:hypothetical protein PR048_013330 [Dryococelus australis]|uniref:Thioredoxin domain-containing protein n=1 Tax=Dryococelus australis TaxID=614101 RepID=A0ABQ9HRV1_9NEOP|nr:hypothetical protein PR048_013330 [Dryococelus australis]
MQLRLGSSTAWLVYFFLGSTHGGDFELKKLPALLPNIYTGKVNCARMASVCGKLNINRYPLFAVFKQGGGHEIYHGRELAHDVATFARESSAAVNVRVLTPHEFHTVTGKGHVDGAELLVDIGLELLLCHICNHAHGWHTPYHIYIVGVCASGVCSSS